MTNIEPISGLPESNSGSIDPQKARSHKTKLPKNSPLGLAQPRGVVIVSEAVERHLSLSGEPSVAVPVLKPPARKNAFGPTEKSTQPILEEANTILGPSSTSGSSEGSSQNGTQQEPHTKHRNMADSVMDYLSLVIKLDAQNFKSNFDASLSETVANYNDQIAADEKFKDAAEETYKQQMAQAAGETVQGAFSIGAGFAPTDSISGGINGAGMVGKSVADFSAADYGLQSADDTYDEKLDEASAQFEGDISSKSSSLAAQSQANAGELLSIMQDVSRTREEAIKSFRGTA